MPRKATKNTKKFIMGIANGIMILARLLEPLFDTKLRMMISGLGLGAFMVFFPLFLSFLSAKNDKNTGFTMGMGLTLAICTSILFRALNSTIDISTYRGFQAIGWGLALLELYTLKMYLHRSKESDLQKESNAANTSIQSGLEQEPDNSPTAPSPKAKIKGKNLPFLSIFGLFSVLFIIYFGFSTANVLSRWTEGNYIFLTIAMILVFCVSGVVLIFQPKIYAGFTKQILVAWNVLFAAALVGTILLNQVVFPDAVTTYPIVVAQPSFFHWIPLAILILSAPILVIDACKLLTNLIDTKHSLPKSALGFTFGGGLFTLLAIFALIFTSTWGFVPPVSFYLRDKFWLVFLIIALFVISSVIFLPKFLMESIKTIKSITSVEAFSYESSTKRTALVVLGVICVGTMAGVIILSPNPPAMPEDVTSLKILTYNLQQGVNDDATKNYDGQLELIRQIDADVIGLQESSKIAGNSDVVRYFAEKLNLYSYFGPRGVTGTTSVALLSKYPILSATTLYHFSLDSDRKQTATIEAQLEIGDEILTIYITHTYGSMEAKTLLVNDVLDRANGKEKVIFIGDFNFREDSDAYGNVTTQFVDAWVQQWPSRVDDNGLNASRRIDHLFVSSDLTIEECRYEDWIETQSDHPAGWVEVSW
ncbi:MAG: endonuclease/exonuclease/phosphatase family protein [Promethearchaeota archaeon]|nr:MAG: endonuclease/exonuclease/phosphatase family protein [Candidatus Lokiarchaeota archaeon]